MAKLLHEEITKDIIGAAFDVQKELGYGFPSTALRLILRKERSGHGSGWQLRTGLEKVYEMAMILELQNRGQQVEQQVPVDVFYKGQLIGHYVADLLVEGKVLVELKTGKKLLSRYEAQLLHYPSTSSGQV